MVDLIPGSLPGIGVLSGHKQRLPVGISPPLGSVCIDLQRDSQGNPPTTQAFASTEVECGAITKTEASSRVAFFPFILTRNPAEKNIT